MQLQIQQQQQSELQQQQQKVNQSGSGGSMNQSVEGNESMMSENSMNVSMSASMTENTTGYCKASFL